MVQLNLTISRPFLKRPSKNSTLRYLELIPARWSLERQIAYEQNWVAGEETDFIESEESSLRTAAVEPGRHVLEGEILSHITKTVPK